METFSKLERALHGGTTLECQSFLTPESSDFELVTGVEFIFRKIDEFPGGRDVVDLHEGGDDLIVPSDG